MEERSLSASHRAVAHPWRTRRHSVGGQGHTRGGVRGRRRRRCERLGDTDVAISAENKGSEQVSEQRLARHDRYAT